MRALVLVGGEGTRLRPLTYTTPKQMLPVVELTMIERVLGHLSRHGIDDVVLSMGYKPDAFVAAFPEDRVSGVHLTYAVEPEPMDTAGAVAFAARHAVLDEAFLVVNGDVLTDLDVAALVGFHEKSGGEATIALTPVVDPSAFGVVPTDADGRVEAFIEKPAPGTAPTDLINAGFYVVEPSVVDRIPEGRRVNIERETFPALVADGALYAFASDAYWTDTGTPALYLDACLDLVSGRRGTGEPVPGARKTGDGSWRLGAPVVDGAVEGHAFVGDAAFVAGGSTVRDAVVGSGARVHPGAVVERSVLLPGAVVHDGARVIGSIIGPGAVVGRDADVGVLTVVGAAAQIEAGAVLRDARVAHE